MSNATEFAVIIAAGLFIGSSVNSCIRDTDHAIVNAYAKDRANAVFSYYTGDGMVTIQQDTVMIRGEFVVIRNGKVVPE